MAIDDIDRNCEDFQTVADAAGERCVEACGEDLEALEHARSGCVIIDAETGEKCANTLPYCHEEDMAREAIEQSPLSVEVRSGWSAPGSTDAQKPTEYNILLGWGGPASRIIGDLDENCQPETAHFEYQDWFKPWTQARLSGEQEDVLVRWAQCFWFGE